MHGKLRLAVAVTGASGAIYAKILMDRLRDLAGQIDEIGLVMSDNAKAVWEHELGNRDYARIPHKQYHKNDFSAPFASGSAQYGCLIVCPCSMGTLGRIAGGISNDLITRAADVMLKERKKLILVTRETPLSLIHIRNMEQVTSAGAIVCPATPSFYSRPATIDELAATVIDRVIDLAGLRHDAYRWGTNQK